MIAPDFSNNNPDPHWARLRLRTNTVGLKASEGTGFVDTTFAYRRRLVQRYHFRVIAYHFARPDVHPDRPEAEAQHFAAVVGHLAGVHTALDFERWSPHLTAAEHVAWARRFNHEVRRIFGVWPLFYTYSSMLAQLHPAQPIGDGLWLANYDRDDGKRHPVAVPHPWTSIALHQYTSRGSLLGVPFRCDLSAVNYLP